MERDTDIGGPRTRFPETDHSAVIATRSDDASLRERAFASIVAAYWKPVYLHVRRSVGASSEDAKDVTQGFFTRAIERGDFARFDPARASFRTYVRRSVEHYLRNQHRDARRLKRGGDAVHVPVEGEEGVDPAADGGDPARAFEEAWARSVLELAVARLDELAAERGMEEHVAIFRRYDLDPDDEGPVRYEDLARVHGIRVTDVTNRLSWARRTFRAVALELLRELTATDAEFRDEARTLFGREPS